MEEETWKRNLGGGIVVEESWRRNSEEESRKRNLVGEIIEEKSGRKNPGRGIEERNHGEIIEE